MSKWHPTAQDLFVIPDIHGNLDLLQKICNRILPLRKSEGRKDKLIFLGDYLDRNVDSHLVLDFLIELEKKYGDQVVFLMGNHELMLLQALNVQPGRNITPQAQTAIHKMWMANGGYDTVAGYLSRVGIDEGWGSLPRNRLLDIIPKEHIEFIQRLRKCYEWEDYIFVHGGLDPNDSVSSQDLEVLAWDRSLLNQVMTAIQTDIELPWEKTIICGHSVRSDRQPIIKDKYMMLDCGSPKQLLVVELGSMESFMAYPNKDRMVKFELKETEKIPGLFRRVQS